MGTSGGNQLSSELPFTESPISPMSSGFPGDSLPLYHSPYAAQPDPDPTSLAAVNPIVFPNVSPNAHIQEKHRDSTETPPISPSSTRRSRSFSTASYRPQELSNLMLKSPNASDHLRRIHVTTTQLCKKRDTGRRFIIFHIIDSALHHVSNTLILDRNVRRDGEIDVFDESQHTSRCWALRLHSLNLLRSCLGHSTLRPGRFYVSQLNEEQEFLNDAGFGIYETVETLHLSAQQGFSLDNLLVLASSLTSPLRFRHPQAIQSPDWYPSSVWGAMKLVSEFIQKEQPLPSPLRAPAVERDTVLLERVLAKHADNLRKYRHKVICRQQSQDSNQGVLEKRQREIEAELERSHREIENQKHVADQLQKESEILAQQRQELNEQLQKLKGE
ncbi:hypothetical protein BDV93DRAFT_612151 [Ceratobasidium sp. AG-I]|nr:hypothetical protein BDV93DRAFT_612151 [Ceratobasidium sp. AG-I]